MPTDRDWTAKFGLSNPKRNGDLDPDWIEDALYFLCAKAGLAATKEGVDAVAQRINALETGGCQKYQRIRWMVIGAIVVAGAGAGAGAAGGDLLAWLRAVIGG